MRTKDFIPVLLIVGVMSCTLVGCDSKHGKIRDTLAEMRGHLVVLSLDRMQCRYGGKDTVVHDSVGLCCGWWSISIPLIAPLVRSIG